jgi:D-3-phosphoglycerate dehydrogenase
MTSPPFKVALIDKPHDEIPAWVATELEQAGIVFASGNCHSREELLALAGDADLVWVYSTSRLARGDNLRLLGRCRAALRSGSGVDQIDVETATELGIVVVNIPHAHHDAVSDHTIGLIFAVGRRLAAQDRVLRSRGWSDRDAVLPLWKLSGKTVGLIGFGLIAREVVRKLSGYDLTFLVHDPFVDDATVEACGVERSSLDDLLAASDIVSIHTPLTADTRQLIGEGELQRMKRGSILINTARGPVVDQGALVRALQQGRLFGAGLDVFEVEPIPADDPLLSLDNVVVSPHSAGISDESIELTWRLSVEACIDLANGRYPRSFVNREVQPREPLAPR